MPRLSNFLVFWAQSRLWQFLNGFGGSGMPYGLILTDFGPDWWCQTSQTQHFQNWEPANLQNLEISKFGKDARRKMIEICLVKSASTSVACWLVTKQMLGFLMLASIKQQALRNWALRLWQEIKKSCSFRLSVSCEKVSSLMRGVYPKHRKMREVQLAASGQQVAPTFPFIGAHQQTCPLAKLAHWQELAH